MHLGAYEGVIDFRQHLSRGFDVSSLQMQPGKNAAFEFGHSHNYDKKTTELAFAIDQKIIRLGLHHPNLGLCPSLNSSWLEIFRFIDRTSVVTFNCLALFSPNLFFISLSNSDQYFCNIKHDHRAVLLASVIIKSVYWYSSCFCSRLVHMLAGHAGEISNAQFNWDCSLIVSGSLDNTCKVSLHTFKPVFFLHPPLLLLIFRKQLKWFI